MDIYVQKNGERLGPLSEDQVRVRIEIGVICPDDLASTSAGVPWQPLSSLINLGATTPPPILTVEKPIVELSSVITERISETILYQDTDDYLASRPFKDYMVPRVPKVVVTFGRLKVGDDSILLDGITNVSLTSPLKRISQTTFIKKIVFWSWFWLSFIPLGFYCYVQRGQPSSWSDLLPWIIFCGLPYVLAKFATSKDSKQQYHRAEITLIRATQSTKVFIGAFRQAPGWISQERDLWKSGITEAAREREYKRRTEYYEQSVTRTKQIAESVGQAIQQKSAVVS